MTPTPDCPTCGGLLGDEGPLGCVCGVAGPFGSADLGAEQWAALKHLLSTRSGGRCEIRIAGVCTGGVRGSLLGVSRTSIHHRQPRGMGGTRSASAHSLAHLLLTCGDGVASCHGYVERRRVEARERGLLVPKAVDPKTVALVMQGGQRLYLDPVSPLYLQPPVGEPRWQVAPRAASGV